MSAGWHSGAGLLITEVIASYIDQVSEELVSTYEYEREHWLRNLSAAREGRVKALLRGERVDIDSSEVILGYRLRQRHVGVVCWMHDDDAGAGALARLERSTVAAERGACEGRPMFVPQDGSCAWAWLPLGGPDSPAGVGSPDGRMAAGPSGPTVTSFGDVLGTNLDENRLQIELALLACRWLGAASCGPDRTGCETGPRRLGHDRSCCQAKSPGSDSNR